MIYSSAFLSTFRAGEVVIRSSSPTAYISSRRIETSDPQEVDKARLLETLRLDEDVLYTENAKGKPFSRPKKPARKN
jgi:twinfilin-like protein